MSIAKRPRADGAGTVVSWREGVGIRLGLVARGYWKCGIRTSRKPRETPNSFTPCTEQPPAFQWMAVLACPGH